MNEAELRQLTLETSAVAIRNIAAVPHTGLVTIRMERGIVRLVWCGTVDGLLVWKNGTTVCHVIPNVEGAVRD